MHEKTHEAGRFFQIDVAFGNGQPDATLVWRRYGHLYPGSSKQPAVALGRYPTAARNARGIWAG